LNDLVDFSPAHQVGQGATMPALEPSVEHRRDKKRIPDDHRRREESEESVNPDDPDELDNPVNPTNSQAP